MRLVHWPVLFILLSCRIYVAASPFLYILIPIISALHALMLYFSDIVYICGAQVLAVAVSAVTDLWTRQAFVKAEQLQQQQQRQGVATPGQQGGATPVSQRQGDVSVRQEAAEKIAVKGQKAVERAVTDHSRGSVQ